jgi:hypothetical protein
LNHDKDVVPDILLYPTAAMKIAAGPSRCRDTTAGQRKFGGRSLLMASTSPLSSFVSSLLRTIMDLHQPRGPLIQQ